MDILDNNYFNLYRDLIYKTSGIHFCDVNRVVLESRIREILRNRKDLNIATYYNLLLNDPEELKKMLDAVTTNLTRFFRNTAHFEALEYYVIPQIVKHKLATGDRTFKFWSAGCSTGEECYSVAMVLKEKLPPDFKITVIGSDLSLTSLMTAKEGRYREDRMNGVPPEYLKKYFTKEGDSYVVKDSLKELIQFDYHNLKEKNFLSNNDVAFCRNVLIYFDRTVQEDVVNLIWDTMSSFSFFFVGHSESLFGMDCPFKFLKTDWACFYTKNLRNLKYE